MPLTRGRLTRSARGWSVALALGLLGAGCTCGTPASRRDTPARHDTPPQHDTATTPREDAPDALTLPRASRRELPVAQPSLTITIDEHGLVVDNAALLASWPPAERARLEARRPPGDDAWPLVHAEVVGGAPSGLRIPGLAEALARATAVERARAGDRHTPTVFSLRVDDAVRYEHVAEVLFTATLAGWTEPRFVLRAADGASTDAVWLAMPLPAGGHDAPRTAGLLVEITAAHRVRVALGARPLGEGCRAFVDAPTDALPDLDPVTFGACVDAATALGPRADHAILSAPGSVAMHPLVALLEALDARVPHVALTIPM